MRVRIKSEVREEEFQHKKEPAGDIHTAAARPPSARRSPNAGRPPRWAGTIRAPAAAAATPRRAAGNSGRGRPARAKRKRPPRSVRGGRFLSDDDRRHVDGDAVVGGRRHVAAGPMVPEGSRRAGPGIIRIVPRGRRRWRRWRSVGHASVGPSQ
jgi:hypothetical protein